MEYFIKKLRVGNKMITIENEEDIRLLISFFEAFNMELLYKKSEDTQDGNLSERINKIESDLREKADFNVKIAKDILQMKSELNKLHSINLEENIEPTIIEIEEDSPVTIRKYGKRIIDEFPKIKALTKEGYFIFESNRTSVWNITDVLRIKKLLPKTEYTFEMMGKKIGFSSYTAKTICCGIEFGYFDKWFKEWEQLQANNFYGKWKPVMQNNPQKREEMGMM